MLKEEKSWKRSGQLELCSCKGAERRKRNTISGDNGERDPPVPIPNTEVKPLSADGTWLETARESRSSPDSIKGVSHETDTFFIFLNIHQHSIDHSY